MNFLESQITRLEYVYVNPLRYCLYVGEVGDIGSFQIWGSKRKKFLSEKYTMHKM